MGWYLEEFVGALSVLVRLAVVHHDGALIDDLHLGEALLRIHQHVYDRCHTYSHKCSNNNVVVCSIAGFLLGPLEHG